MAYEQRMYFGTRERMTWVNPPSTDMNMGMTRWAVDGVLLNGGSYARSSTTGSKRYSLAWPMASQADIYKIVDYSDGLYGSGLIYFLDPFAMGTNVLPQYWAAPRLGQEDAPTLVKDVLPVAVATSANTFDYPTKTAVYTIKSGNTFASLWVPIPPGYAFHFGAHGSSTGASKVTVQPDGGAVANMTLLSVVTSMLTNYVVTDVTGVTVTCTGIGTLSLAGMIGQVLPVGEPAPVGQFISGRGHSGCRFVGAPSVSGFSAPSALDRVSASAVLAETGAWENN